MLDPPTHNRPFADKRDKVGMDFVIHCIKLTYSILIYFYILTCRNFFPFFLPQARRAQAYS